MRVSQLDSNFLNNLCMNPRYATSLSRIQPGTQIGRVIVDSYAGALYKNKRVNHYYFAHCTCGCPEKLIFPENSLKTIGLPGKAQTISCGCAGAERTEKAWKARVKNKYTTRNKAATIYYAIRQRCYCPTYRKYKVYGGRGIKMCPEWEDLEHGLDNFCDWMYNEAGYSDDLGAMVSVDRVDNDGPYSPENCHLSTNNGQANNKSQNVNHIWYNQLYNAHELCKQFGFNYDRFRRLHNEDKSDHEILFGPIFNSAYERQQTIAKSPNGLVVTPRAFVFEPFQFVDHSEISPCNRWRARSYNNYCPNEISTKQTLNMIADKYRLSERDQGRPVKPFQITNSGSDEFLLSTYICAENYNF